MLSVSDEFKKAIQSTERVLSAKLVFDSKTFLGDEIKSIELNDDILGSGSEFKIGTFITTKGKIQLINTSVPETLEGKECNIYIGIKLEDETFEYVDLGIFKVIEEDVKGQVITLTVEDRTNKFDIKYAPTVTFPCTLKTIVNNVCNQVGVTLNSDFFNCDYVIKNDPAIAEDVTCRKVIIAVAELMGGYARINTLGKLEFFNLAIKSNDYFAAGTEVFYTSDDSNILDSIVGKIDLSRHNYFEFENSKNPIERLTKVSIMFNNIYCSKGSDDGKNYVISDNILINTVENQELCNRLFEKLNGLEYKPMSLKWIGNPSFQCGDAIEIYDGNIFHYNYIMTRKLSFSGGLTEIYSSSGFSKEKDKTTVPGSIRQQVKKAMVDIKILDEEVQLRVTQGEFETYVSATAKELSSKVTADGACNAIVQRADELKISIDGKLAGQTYTFDGTGFSLGGKTGDVVKHTNSGSEYNFADGSKAVIDKDGFYNLIGTTKNEYHHLTKVYRMTPTTNKKFTMTLPDEFKGKKFYLAPSVSIINKPIGSEPWRLSYLEIQAEPLSYEEGTIQIWCYSMWVNQNTGSTEITIPTMTLLVIA